MSAELDVAYRRATELIVECDRAQTRSDALHAEPHNAMLARDHAPPPPEDEVTS